MNLKKALSLAMATAMVAGVASVATFAKDVIVDSGSVYDSGAGNVIVDGDIIGDTIVSDNAVYFVPNNQYYGNSDNFKFSAKKGDNAKLIKKISFVEKNVIGSSAREWVVKIEINEDMTDTEYKMNPKITFTAKDTFAPGALAAGSPAYASGAKDEFTIKFWIQNGKVSGGTDQSNLAGTTGYYAKPEKNDDNEVVWNDNNRDLAKLTFYGDSDVKVYYPKLSTKWDNDVYAANFANGEAYKFEFVGNPSISATARPTLTIYNPFINDDEEYTVDAAELTIYQLIEDEFVNVTDKFTAGTDDDGNQVLTTKTRTLGYYVVCDEAAAASGEITTDEPIKDIPETGR